MKENVRAACMADTPLQLLNLLCFMYYDVEGLRGACDLYLHHQFSGYDGIEEALRETHLFRRVIECRLPREMAEQRAGWGHALRRLSESLFPGAALRRLTGQRVKRNAYELLLLPAPIRLSVILRDRNPAAEIWFYEEGSASYAGNIQDAFGPRYKNLLKKLLRRGHAMVEPTRLYVHSPALCQGAFPYQTLPLPLPDVSDTGFRTVLEGVFGSLPKPVEAQLIYLSTPPGLIVTSEGVDAAQIERGVIRALLPYADKTLVRPHPKEGQRDYEGLPVDHHPAQWELLCATRLREDQVLLGHFSTAQLMPKLLFDKEPALIFTWRLYDMPLSEERKRNLVGLLNSIRSAYREPGRVYDVASPEELRAALNETLGSA